MRIAQKHPITDLQHPWAVARGILGLSQEALAERCSVTTNTVLRTEKGLFRSPPPSIMEYLGMTLASTGYTTPGESSIKMLRGDYYGYQKEKRRRFKNKYLPPGSYDLLSNTHPLVMYRGALGLSRMGFCSALCIHPYTVEEWEKRRRREIPRQIKEAFEEAKIDPQPLIQAVEEWRQR